MGVVFRTSQPVTGFFRVTKVIPHLLERETKLQDGTSWSLSGNYIRWNLTIPGEEITITETLQSQEYKRLCKEYGIRDDVRYFSPNPIRKFYLAQGLRSINLVLEDNQTQERQTISERATLDTKVGMEESFANPRYAGQEIAFPPLGGHLRVQLDNMPPLVYQWGFWYADETGGNHSDREDYLLILDRKGLDLSHGRLLLIFEREGDTPLEVELPQHE